MTVEFTRDVEARRQAQSWEYHRGVSLVTAVHKAKEMGWKERKVQVRAVEVDGGLEYYVEPYEKNCGCLGILKYRDYFD